MKTWGVSYSRDGFNVALEEVKWWAPIFEKVNDALEVGTAHWFCCCMPDLLWKIPVGKRTYEYDYRDEKTGKRTPDRSLASLIADFAQWRGAFVYRHGTKSIKHVPVDRETGIFLWNRSEDSWIWDKNDN